MLGGCHGVCAHVARADVTLGEGVCDQPHAKHCTSRPYFQNESATDSSSHGTLGEQPSPEVCPLLLTASLLADLNRPSRNRELEGGRSAKWNQEQDSEEYRFRRRESDSALPAGNSFPALRLHTYCSGAQTGRRTTMKM
jgi:hypothetical protein